MNRGDREWLAREREREVRMQREGYVHRLVVAQRSLRNLLIWRALLVVAVAANIPGILLLGNWASLASMILCTLTLVVYCAKAIPRGRKLVTDCQYGFRRVQREYDDVFAQMIAVELGEPLNEIEHRTTFYCPDCAERGHWNGYDPHDMAVPPGHERQIEGDGEMWVVCHAFGEARRWRYDPYAQEQR